MDGSYGSKSCQPSRRRLGMVLVLLLLGGWILLGASLRAGYSADDSSTVCAPRASYTYDVSPDGPVKVTIHPGDAQTILIPVTAEKIQATDLTYELEKDWELFKYTVAITPTGPNPTLTYVWPDGALPWPVNNCDFLQDSDKKWSTDSYWTKGPADVTLILPTKADVMEIRDCGCRNRTETGSDGRSRAIFDVPAGQTIASWTGVVYKYPWASKYSVYGKSPLPLYYPTVLGNHPEYMTKLKEFHAANEEYYRTYKTRMKYAPQHDISINLISWIQGYGGAYTAGNGVYYDYRRLPAFEWPPVKNGDNLMGAYHEMAHAFEPACAPWYIGGHTWTAYWTMDYDWNYFPTAAEVARRKQQGGAPDDSMHNAYNEFLELRKAGLVPGLWYKWPEDDEKIKLFPGMEVYRRDVAEIQEAASTYVLLQLDHELGQDFWGKYTKECLAANVTVDVDEPVQQKIVAAVMCRAAGRDLIPLLTKLTDCDLMVTPDEKSENTISNGGMENKGNWELDAWQKDARLVWDDKVSHSGRKSLRLDCPTPNDARAVQVVHLKPKTFYLLTSWVKTKDIGSGTSGATICVLPNTGSKTIDGTTDWQRIMVPLYSGETGEVAIGLRIGWFSQPTAGTAWFDDVGLIPLFSQKGWQMAAGGR